MKKLIYLGLLLGSMSLFAVEETYQFDDPQRQALFNELSHQLRCPKCQNQNIADSNALVALDLKRKVYQLVKQGQSKQKVVDYMKERYGEFVYYQPPVTAATLILWILPLLIVITGFVLLLRRRKIVEVDTISIEKAEKLLEKE
ncbi:cytochrome c-type biogenesis protein [Neptunicella sp. SCSIO 80796]|uniref:cytochrome c-type biogenesis protein n=1 Tax=Neptunicella plasticusilytica TaxID=3117012 RepID=UPI003A4E4D28